MFTPVVRRYARYALEFRTLFPMIYLQITRFARDLRWWKFKIDEFFLFGGEGGEEGEFF